MSLQQQTTNQKKEKSNSFETKMIITTKSKYHKV